MTRWLTQFQYCNDSCAVKMYRLWAAGCQDIVSFGNQLLLCCPDYNKSLVFKDWQTCKDLL